MFRKYFKHLYTKNRNSEGLVYEFADESVIAITKKDFLKSVPGTTETDFK